MSEFIMTPRPSVRLWCFFDRDGDNVARVTLPVYAYMGGGYAPSDQAVAEAIVRAEGVKFDPKATESRPVLQGASGPHWDFHRIAVPYAMVVGNREVTLPVGTLVQLNQMDVLDEEYPGSQFMEYGAVVRPVVSVPALDEWKGIYLAERGPVGDLWKNAPVLVPADRIPHHRPANKADVAKFLLTLETLGMGFHLDEDPATLSNASGPMCRPTEVPALRERQREVWNVAREAGFCPHDLCVEAARGLGDPTTFVHSC